MAEETRAITKEMRAAVAGGVVTIALVALFAVGHKAGLTETTAYALAIATGLVIYGVVSGRLTEFSGGGLSAKLTSIVHSEINITSVSLKALSDDMGVIKSIPKRKHNRVACSLAAPHGNNADRVVANAWLTQ